MSEETLEAQSPSGDVRARLHRIRGTELPRYTHPNGWRICKRRRDYTTRGITRGARHQASALTWYEISSQGRSATHVVAWFERLRDARAWCDEHNA